MLSNQNYKEIYTEFSNEDKINYIITATQQEEKCRISNDTVNLIKGRIYYIPISDKTINSDVYENIKIMSNIADKIEVKYLKDGISCIIPIVNNVKLHNNTMICKIPKN